MMLAEIAYPRIDPVLFEVGPFDLGLFVLGPLALRWYALAYVAALLIGWGLARALLRRDRLWGGVARPSLPSIDDLLVYAAFGVVVGGRLGYVMFYDPSTYIAHPGEIVAVWKGGMSFHGGLLGAAVAIWLFSRRHGVSPLVVADLCAAVVPVGLFLGRVANFIKPELWGRATDVPWAMVFPDAGPVPRHPSQLYEAFAEGVLLFALLHVAIRLGAFRRPGLVAGLFGAGYGIARIACEFFREPDPQLGFLFGGATMGMLLSLPLILAGLACLAMSRRRAA